MGDKGRVMAGWGKRLVNKMTCPNCWHRFYPEEVLFVAKHPELTGDPIIGQDEYARFLAGRFTVKGEAVDARGFATSEMACPRCHLHVPDSMLEVPPMFISLVGSPASGKSYFLTAMTFQLRHILPRLRLLFTDADPIANSPLHEYEQTLFLNPRPEEPTEIRKTHTLDAKLHRTAMLEGAPIRFPLPFQFTLQPMAAHEHFRLAHQIGRIVVLYDNAGEDFLPGSEDRTSAVVQHLARSQVLFMLFDPMQDPRFRGQCRQDDPQLAHGLRPGSDNPPVTLRQETILREVTVRIRRYLGLAQDKRIKVPLIVIVPKFDVWSNVADVSLDLEPYQTDGDGPEGSCRLDLGRVEQVSDALERIFTRLCPEFMATAGNLSENVRFVPVSSLGRSPIVVKRGGRMFYGIRPKDIAPKWVTVPLVYALARWATGMIARTDEA